MRTKLLADRVPEAPGVIEGNGLRGGRPPSRGDGPATCRGVSVLDASRKRGWGSLRSTRCMVRVDRCGASPTALTSPCGSRANQSLAGKFNPGTPASRSSCIELKRDPTIR